MQHETFSLPVSPCPGEHGSGAGREQDLQILSNLRCFCWNFSKHTGFIQTDLKWICRCFASVRTKILLWILTSDLECSSYFCRSLICELNFRYPDFAAVLGLVCTETDMFCGGWNYSRGNPCGGFANILQLFPETLLPIRQSFTAIGGHADRFRGFKFIFN